MRWGHVGAGRAALGSLPPPGDVLRSQKLSPGCGGACRTTRRGPEAPLGLMLWGRNQHPACWQLVFCAALGDGGWPARPRVSGSPSHRCHSCSPPRHSAASMVLQPAEPCVGFPGVQGEQQHPTWMHARGCCGQDLGSALWKAAPAAGREKPASILLPRAWEPNFPTPPGPSKCPNHPALPTVLVPCAPAHLFSLLISWGVEIIP